MNSGLFLFLHLLIFIPYALSLLCHHTLFFAYFLCFIPTNSLLLLC